jgi:hypothetical protein
MRRRGGSLVGWTDMGRRSRKTPQTPLSPGQRRQMMEDARSKLEDAEFFLGKMQSLDGSPNLETHRDFQRNFSAFLLLARAPLQILCPSGNWSWVNSEMGKWSAGQKDLNKLLVDLRNRTIHVGRAEAEVGIQTVPEHELSHRHRAPAQPEGRVFYMTGMPGSPRPQIGVRTYTLQVGPDRRGAVECCREYLNLVRGLVDYRDGMTSW